jgi:hypothetical protein
VIPQRQVFRSFYSPGRRRDQMTQGHRRGGPRVSVHARRPVATFGQALVLCSAVLMASAPVSRFLPERLIARRMDRRFPEHIESLQKGPLPRADSTAPAAMCLSSARHQPRTGLKRRFPRLARDPRVPTRPRIDVNGRFSGVLAGTFAVSTDSVDSRRP